MKRRTLLASLAAGTATGLIALPARAVAPLRVGIIAPFTGEFGDYGRQIEAGMRARLLSHGDTVAGRRIELLPRDTGGPLPEVARRLAEELVERERVDFLAGFGFSPEAFGAAPVAEKARIPMVVMNAAAAHVPARSSYIVRISMSLAQLAGPMATWALKNGIQRVATLVSDFAPGVDAEGAFSTRILAGGGSIVASERIHLRVPEFGPALQRIRARRPQALFVFVPAGNQGIDLLQQFQDQRLASNGIRLIATGDMLDEPLLQRMGPSALGVVTTGHYSTAHPSPENEVFLRAYARVSGGRRANFMAVAGHDGMAAIADTARRMDGRIDGAHALQLLRSFRMESPRGPISIDPDTRDIVQTVYVRRVERVGDEYRNVEFDSFPAQKASRA